MKEWLTAGELAGLPGMPGSDRNVRMLAGRRGWENRKRQRGKGYEFHIRSLPAETQAALISRCATQPSTAVVSELAESRSRRKQPTCDRETLWSQFAAARQAVKDEGSQRAKLLCQVMQLADHGTGLFESFNAVAMANAVPVATLRGWYYGANGRPGAKDYDRNDWPAVLMPRYTGRTATADVAPEAWDYFKGDYLRLEQPAASACYERLQRIARERGWKVPSVRTLLRKLNREIPKPAIILAREGVDALKRSYPAQRRDHAWYHALQAVNADGHTFDVFVEWGGEIVRPVMIAWQDIMSGKILGWRVEKHESSCGYRLSFGDMIEQFGIPEHAYVDNGRGIAAKHLTGGTPNRYRFKVRDEDPIGIITQLGIDVHWTTPYHGQAKPIERAFRDLCEYVAKHPAFAGAYTGNNPTAKPENYRSRAVPIAEFLRVLDQEIIAHNARTGRRSAVCNGRSFDQVFSESYEQSLIRKATAEQRRLWLLAAEGVSANRKDGSISLDKNRYWSEALSAYAAQKLIVRFDPDRLHDAVHCYTLDGRYIGQAECIQAAGFGDTEAAREHARLRKQYVNANKQQLACERRMNALEAAALLPDQPEPADTNSKVVRPVFDEGAPVRKRAVNESPAADESDLEGGFNEHVTRLWEDKKSQLL